MQKTRGIIGDAANKLIHSCNTGDARSGKREVRPSLITVVEHVRDETPVVADLRHRTLNPTSKPAQPWCYFSATPEKTPPKDYRFSLSKFEDMPPIINMGTHDHKETYAIAKILIHMKYKRNILNPRLHNGRLEENIIEAMLGWEIIDNKRVCAIYCHQQPPTTKSLHMSQISHASGHLIG